MLGFYSGFKNKNYYIFRQFEFCIVLYFKGVYSGMERVEVQYVES